MSLVELLILGAATTAAVAEGIDGVGESSTGSSPDPVADDSGKTWVGIGLSVACLVVIVLALCHSAYYQRTKLKLQRAYLERMEPRFHDVVHEVGNNLETGSPFPPPPNDQRRAADPPYGLFALHTAVIAGSWAQLEDSTSASAQENAKTKSNMPEEKVLGRLHDIRPSNHGALV